MPCSSCECAFCLLFGLGRKKYGRGVGEVRVDSLRFHTGIFKEIVLEDLHTESIMVQHLMELKHLF